MDLVAFVTYADFLGAKGGLDFGRVVARMVDYCHLLT